MLRAGPGHLYRNVLGVLFTVEVYFRSKTQHTTARYSRQISKLVRTIHRRAIGPLARQNSTSAYSPSLTCHILAPTIDCLHNSRDPQETPSTGPPLLLSPNTSWLLTIPDTGLKWVGYTVEYVTMLYRCSTTQQCTTALLCGVADRLSVCTVASLRSSHSNM
jgi:hypothetical protein